MLTYMLCICLVVGVIKCDTLQKTFSYPYSNSNMSSVHKLQEYLQIDTSRQENIETSTEFWREEARALGLDFKVYRPAGLPVCVLTWRGSSPELPSIMLNSHADVVPVYESQWTYPPFSGHIDENGDIYGRGAQDTKSIGIQYVEAIRRLKESGVTLKRTIHVTVVPDEEVGSDRGMRPFLKSLDFKSLNVGFVLDEGMTSPDATLYATYVDKRPWQMEITIRENSGHPSSLPEKDIIQKLQKLLDMTLNFRSEQILIKKNKSPTDFGAYCTLNINSIQGGIANNVIPSEMRVVVDIRLSVSTSATEMQEMVDSWARTLGNGTEVRFIRRADESASTPVDGTNPYWLAMKEVASDLDITLLPIVCPATSDMLFVRELGIPALGFAPKQHTRNKLHDHNEYIPVDVFLRGIEIYVAMINRLGDLN